MSWKVDAMRVIALLWRGFLPVWLASAAAAQMVVGEPLPEPTWQTWVQGEAVAVAGERAPACTVLSFHTQARDAAAFAGDGDYLADLQRRFGDKGLVVVAVVGDGKPAGRENWPGCRIVVDQEFSTSRALTKGWTGDAGEAWPWNVVVVGKGGVVQFLGRSDSGLVDAVEATLAGREARDAELRAFQLRLDLPSSFDNVRADILGPLAQALEHAPRDGVLLGLLYLAQATKANDAAAAKKVVERATAALANEPRPLAAFVDLALRGDPRRAGLAASLKPVVHAAVAAAPNDGVVQLAFLRTLVQCGDAREVGRQSVKVRKVALATAATSLDFATILIQDSNAPVHRDLATMAIDKAAALGADPRHVLAARYGVAVRCANDGEAAHTLLEQYVKDREALITINNDCWYLMTELPTMGRFDVFAGGLAERMLEHKDGMDAFEFDTAALAMFLNGRTAEAVALQETAIQKGGGQNPEYEERLQRYKAGVLPAPR